MYSTSSPYHRLSSTLSTHCLLTPKSNPRWQAHTNHSRGPVTQSIIGTRPHLLYPLQCLPTKIPNPVVDLEPSNSSDDEIPYSTCLSRPRTAAAEGSVTDCGNRPDILRLPLWYSPTNLSNVTIASASSSSSHLADLNGYVGQLGTWR
ncbi:hypothetical protein FA13DRAFT_120443 [Coprinellus micaceus]|uniref:Uncharacterized protein n=1 Tax=Coprinellus micaceus TaxID=71717 RepID=A0A4Y7TIE3_COPMI|nr:hypothetical protein FA13DRAFT_120443 [Coprinellus micaceus]